VTRRRAVRLSLVALLCLLLGAATTVGVAWWLGHPARLEAAYSLGGLSHAPAGRMAIRAIDGVPLGYAGYSCLYAGWPFLALDSVERFGHHQGGFAGPWTLDTWAEGLGAPDWWSSAGSHRHLPVHPVWPGFALDTALYAAVWWALLFTPLPFYRAARHRLRVSRGMCPSCGYDLKGSPGGACPECGNVTKADT
jgi:hypothetical protein